MSKTKSKGEFKSNYKLLTSKYINKHWKLACINIDWTKWREIGEAWDDDDV